MRELRAWVIVALVALAPTALAAQAETSKASGPDRSTEGGSTARTVRSSDAAIAPMKPAQLVAARVRAILQGPDDDAAWQELAGALPELAVDGGADVETTFEAARLAEGMLSTAAGEPARTATSTTGTVAARVRVMAAELADQTDPETLAQVLAVGLAILALAMLLRGATGRPAKARIARRRTGTKSRAREAQAMAEGGVPIYEIARRTGLARDAVAVLMSRGAR